MSHEEQLQNIISKAASEIGLSLAPESISIDRSKDPLHGDFATNVAMKNAKMLGKKPQELAKEIVARISSPLISKIEIAGPGFINFFMKTDSLASVIDVILEEGERYGQAESNGKSINIEFVSANPTGDLHLGHTRGAALGDAIASLYEKAGYQVTREYYVNDCGNQVKHLGHSLRGRYHELFGEELQLDEDDYHGEDLIAIAKEIKDLYGDKYLKDSEESESFFIRFGIDHELGKIKKDLADFGVKFDRFSYESDIRKDGRVEKTIEELAQKGFTYVQDGATYLRTSAFLDDKDRPIIKADGLYTYFMPDICYHYDKLSRGYDLIVDMLGADHHGYINRMKSALMMKGYSPDILQVGIYQIVRVYKNGEEVKMSKRTGKAIAHRDLVAEVGKDAVRYFFSERSGDTHLDFNLDLALSKSKDNPVYYAQYAHARCVSLLDMGKGYLLTYVPEKLNSEKEGNILKQLAEFPSMIKGAAEIRAPYKVAGYIQKLSALIHEYYAATKIIDRDDQAGTSSRLSLIASCRIVLQSALAILGVSAPKSM